MKEQSALVALSALSHQSRLTVFGLLLEAGPNGLPAGEIGQRLGVPPNALSFHLTRLRHAGLVRNKRNGRQMVYAADYAGMQSLMDFLTENCCQRSAGKCSPACSQKTSSSQTNKKHPRETPRSAQRRVRRP